MKTTTSSKTRGKLKLIAQLNTPAPLNVAFTLSGINMFAWNKDLCYEAMIYSNQNPSEDRAKPTGTSQTFTAKESLNCPLFVYANMLIP